MLRFIIGRAGTGKTTVLLEAMREKLGAGAKRVVYLVPEQYSFEAERQLYRRLEPNDSLNAEALSFTRLCDGVFRAYGGLSGVPLTDTARYLLMSVAVEETRDKLRLYQKSAAKTAFLETLVAACGEFKSAGVSGEALLNFAGLHRDGELKAKLGELGLIFSAYQSLIEHSYKDPEDAIPRACMLLENNDFFAGTSVFVDGFTTFMAAEFELLGHVIGQADDVTFAFTADSLFDHQRGLGLFSAAKQAMARLARLAEKNGVEVADPVILTEFRRFARPELEAVARDFMEPAPPEYRGPYTGALRLTPAADSYGELDAAAAEIARLTREEGFRYNEIGVVAREPESYARAVEAAFMRRGIPYFMSVTGDVENSPLAAGLTAALGAARGFDSQQVLLFAKSPLLGLDAGDVAALENYCYCWDIRGALWHADFTRNPRGLARMEDADLAALTRINEVRSWIVPPLLRLRDAIKDADGRAFAKAVYNFLTEIGAVENLTAFVKAFDGGQDALGETARLWDAVMQILDIFGTALAARKMPAARLCELFRLALSAAGTASPPETLDQVLVGGADRIRPEKLRAVFVVGANEGVFPAPYVSAGVFSEPERRELKDAGLELAAGGLERAALEKYFAHFALTLPSERLYVSWPRSSLKGRELLPSEIVGQLQAMFPKLLPIPADPLLGVSGESSALDALAGGFLQDGPLTNALREYFAGPLAGERYAYALARMKRAAERPARGIGDKSVAKKLFGSSMRLSPSRVEQYHRCPFSYFARYGINIKRRDKVRFSGLEYGSAAHHVLEVMLRLHGGKGLCKLTERQISDEIAGIIHEYLAMIAGDEEMLSERFKFLYGRLCSTLTRLIRRLAAEFAQCGFEPYALEMPVKLGGPVEPVRFETEDGVSVVVEGVVDRVDVMNKNGRRFVRVVDYKSGVKDFKLGDVLYGLNLQMLLYLFAIAENGKDGLWGATPAGVLYMPSRESYFSAGRDITGEDAKKEFAKQWRMSGLLLDDEEALRGMESELAGIFIPAKAGKDGKPDASSQIAGAAEFARLGRKVERLVTDMARLLTEGRIEALPASEDGAPQCERCDYGAVCGFEPEDETVRVKKFGKQEFFKLLAEEEDDA